MRPLFLISLLAVIVFFQINGEKIPVNEGAIDDGVFYRTVGQTFVESIEEQGYNLVQLTRILPFALLNLSFSALHIVKDNEGMRNGMILWQLIYLAISVYWYFRIAKKIRAKTPLMTLGFILLFFNFTWLKEFWYHPFSPDGAAFALGMGQANYFLRYEKFKLGMVSILGAFVSPLLVISGILMLFLPGDKLVPYVGERPKSTFPLLFAVGLPILLAIAGWGLWGWGDRDMWAQIAHVLSLVAIAPLSIWIAQRNTIDWEQSLALLKKRARPNRLNKGIMVLMGILLVLVLLSGKNEALGIRQMLQDIGRGSFRFPIDFLLGLVLQWGLVLLFTAMYLHRFTEQLGRQGWAAVATIWVGMAILPFFTASTLAAWVPLWTVILLKGMKRYHLQVKDLILIGAYALLLSLAWLQVNSPALNEWLLQPGRTTNLLIQKWAVHLPEYRSFWAYLIAAGIMAAIGSLLYLRKGRYQRIIRV